MSEGGKGVIAMLAACVIWGLSPIYYKAVDYAPPLEVLVHRTLWSAIFFAGALAVQGRLRLVGAALGQTRSAVIIAAAALIISGNWLVFIMAIQWDQTTEASLGYFIFPLASVLLGMAIFGERLDRAQAVAVILAALALMVLTWGLGAAPWIALALAGSFSTYGALKKLLATGPVVSVTAEVLLLSPIALALFWWIEASGAGHFGTALGHSLMLALAGPITAVPLILFSYAARRLRMATLGLLQYLNPSLQFLVAIALFQEAFTPFHAVAFVLIWLALVVYSAAILRQERAARKRASSAGTPSQTAI